jgi:hypothetical protein
MASLRSLTLHRRQLPVLVRWGVHLWRVHQPTLAAVLLWAAPRLRWSCHLRTWRGQRVWLIQRRRPAS